MQRNCCPVSDCPTTPKLHNTETKMFYIWCRWPHITLGTASHCLHTQWWLYISVDRTSFCIWNALNCTQQCPDKYAEQPSNLIPTPWQPPRTPQQSHSNAMTPTQNILATSWQHPSNHTEHPSNLIATPGQSPRTPWLPHSNALANMQNILATSL